MTFVALVTITCKSQDCKLSSLIGNWKGTLSDSVSNFNYEITFNTDLTYVKFANGVKTEGTYKISRKVFKLYSCGKRKKCGAYFGRLVIFGNLYKKMFHNDCRCQIRLPEKFILSSKSGKEEIYYKYICYIKT